MNPNEEINMSKPFLLSIETDAGTYIHSAHLGNDEKVARQIAEEILAKRVPKIGKSIKTVALIVNTKVHDVFDGSEWFSEHGFSGFDAAEVV